MKAFVRVMLWVIQGALLAFALGAIWLWAFALIGAMAGCGRW
jgi:hypothetical protein